MSGSAGSEGGRVWGPGAGPYVEKCTSLHLNSSLPLGSCVAFRSPLFSVSLSFLACCVGPHQHRLF